MGGGTVLCPLCGINGIVRYRCGYGRLPAGKGITAASRRSASESRGGGSAAQVAGYLIRKAGAADTVCVGNRILLDCSVQNKTLRLRRSSCFCFVLGIRNNFLMIMCKMRQIRFRICYAIGFCAISNRTGGNNHSAIQRLIIIRGQFVILHGIRCAYQCDIAVSLDCSSAEISRTSYANISADIHLCSVQIKLTALLDCVAAIKALGITIICRIATRCLVIRDGATQQIYSGIGICTAVAGMD